MIRVSLPYHLRKLADVGAEVSLEIPAPATQRAVLDALEARYPMLKGTMRRLDDATAPPVAAFLRLRTRPDIRVA